VRVAHVASRGGMLTADCADLRHGWFSSHSERYQYRSFISTSARDANTAFRGRARVIACSRTTLYFSQSLPPRTEGPALARLHSDMLISEVLSSCPGAAAVFERHGLACASCLASSMESLSAVASVHDVSLELLLADLEELAETDPSCLPQKETD
jgi:hybrid cluster-associated redox disulfide protein